MLLIIRGSDVIIVSSAYILLKYVIIITWIGLYLQQPIGIFFCILKRFSSIANGCLKILYLYMYCSIYMHCSHKFYKILIPSQVYLLKMKTFSCFQNMQINLGQLINNIFPNQVDWANSKWGYTCSKCVINIHFNPYIFCKSATDNNLKFLRENWNQFIIKLIYICRDILNFVCIIFIW